jgi:hypothetical protein
MKLVLSFSLLATLALALFAVRPRASAQDALADTKRVKIPANSPDAFRLGSLKKGDVIVLRYIEGRWKAHGHLATDNPDVVQEERGHQGESRLAIASASKNGSPGAVIALVPPLTTKTPFKFSVPQDRDDLVLRINKNSQDQGNPGAVTYELTISH